MKIPTFWSSLTFQVKKLFPAVEWLTFWRLHRSVSIFDKQDWSYPMMGAIQTFQKLNVCKEFKCSMVQWYFARMALKPPIVNLITASQSCFPKNSTSIPSPRFPSKVFLKAEKIMIFYLLFLGDMKFRMKCLCRLLGFRTTHCLLI